LRARDFTVSGVTRKTALFQWHHDAKHTIHDTKFKLSCKGVRQYIDPKAKLIEESDDFEYTTYASSRGKEHYFIDCLEPNTCYKCTIVTIAHTLRSKPTHELTFTTQYGGILAKILIILFTCI